MTKELYCLQELGGEKNFELSLIELLDYGTIVICIYRTSDGKFDIFLNSLELLFFVFTFIVPCIITIVPK